MEKTLVKIAFASLFVGVGNPVVCLLVLIFSNVIGLVIFAVGVPLVGVLCGIAGLFAPGKAKLAAITGIVLNMGPIVVVVLLWVLFSSSSFGIWR